jgi:hypothetical protein
MLEAVDQPLYAVAGALDLPIEGSASMLVGPPGYRYPYAQAPQIAPHYTLGVALVSTDALRRQPRPSRTTHPLDLSLLHKRPEAHHLVSLSLAEIEHHRFA